MILTCSRCSSVDSHPRVPCAQSLDRTACTRRLELRSKSTHRDTPTTSATLSDSCLVTPTARSMALSMDSYLALPTGSNSGSLLAKGSILSALAALLEHCHSSPDTRSPPSDSIVREGRRRGICCAIDTRIHRLPHYRRSWWSWADERVFDYLTPELLVLAGTILPCISNTRKINLRCMRHNFRHIFLVSAPWLAPLS